MKTTRLKNDPHKELVFQNPKDRPGAKSSGKMTSKKYKAPAKQCSPAVLRQRAKVKQLRAELREAKNAHSDLLVLFKLAFGGA